MFRRLGAWAIVIVLLASATTAAANDVGTIHFPTSTPSEAAQAHFLRGATILHSFGFKQAIEAFRAAQAEDPEFALAYWGESLCYNHPFLPEWDRKTPQAVLRRLGATPAERLAKAPTPREKGFVRAVEALFFGPGTLHDRRTAHSEAMAALHAKFPDDDEVAAHYALSLISAGGASGEAGERQRIQAGAIALDLFGRDPDHPGAAHYTIHAFDDPIHAVLALPAARRFASIAPAVSHARHMPSHIFIQLGMWDDVSTSNQAAYDAAVALWEPGDSAGDMTHALDWGQYGDLQRGDYPRAEAWIAKMRAIVAKNPDQERVADALPRVEARYVIETRDWKKQKDWGAQKITDSTPATTLYVTGLSAAALGDVALARRAAGLLAARAEDAEGGDSLYHRAVLELRVMAEQVAGVAALADGDTKEGLARLEASVAIAEEMPLPRGAADPSKPAHELHGEALLAAEHPDDAARQFEAQLLRTPNRPRSLLGLARARTALGDRGEARRLDRALLRIWGDRDVPEREEVEKRLAAQAG